MKISPPRLFLKFFRWYCHPRLIHHIEGDLVEEYNERVRLVGKKVADQKFIIDVILLFRPSIIRPIKGYRNLTTYGMYKNYLKVAWRNLIGNKGYSVINIGGLTVGITVALFVGLWVLDELSYNKDHKHYPQIAQVLQHQFLGHGVETYTALPIPLAATLRENYGNDFQHVAAAIFFEQFVSNNSRDVFTRIGAFAEAQLPEMLALTMVSGKQNTIDDPQSMLISESLANAIFGDEDPINKEITINNRYTQKITGVYEDIPRNSRFHDVKFIAPLSLLVSNGAALENWGSSSFEIFVKLHPRSDFVTVSSKIRNVLYENSGDAAKPELALHPMSQWYLYEFKNGVLVWGRLKMVWLFGTIGVFVLVLACINFVNLNTARAEKRAKEVGIRKTMGSVRLQLINQFFTEAFLIVLFSFIVGIVLLTSLLPAFNAVAGKQISIPWNNLLFILTCAGFLIITVLLSGSYPAFYLSGFNPIKVMKATHRTGRLATLPRKMLVVLQFTISITLIIGTIVIFQQIQFAKNRPIGYNRDRLVTIPFNNPEIQRNYNSFRDELLRLNHVENIAIASNSTTDISSSANNLEWEGKDPNIQMEFGTILIDPYYGDVVEWRIIEGRNFSNFYATDSSAFIFNEAAIRQMGLKDPIGKNVKWHGRNWNIIGVAKNMIMESPFDNATPTVFLIDPKERSFNVIHLKLKADFSATESLKAIEAVFKTFSPSAPFDYSFADADYGQKFLAEERIGKLASIFSLLAILISLLGVFGLASYVAERRTKEIGIRKVVGASLFHIWTLLSKDFVGLVMISCGISIPFAYYLLFRWLQAYEYKTTLSWWIFVATGFTALVVTLLTVSFQSIKAALVNPVNSLRSE